MKYVYPAVISDYGAEGYGVEFPDISGAATCGKNFAILIKADTAAYRKILAEAQI